ncbi:hypothetical protein PF010_g25096 [Phytophthora fragariae]|uniref:Uncharacterized protein n=1 Tax=Phytophthora fragariae TaxID=53985 RepID=A0A6G0K1C1_9STRA|nr:hypothetical protein PF010_g25096 [Phytophthora fragariae]KAE9181775.1 hypothetical protein PF004_g24433 [Phytophthora fragariae]
MSSTTVLQKKSAIPRQRESSVTLELSPVFYAAAWVFIVLFHAACGTFLICMAMTYWFLTTSIMPFYVSLWSLKGIEHYRFNGVVFGIVGAMHGVRVLDLIVMSIRGRQLRLQSESTVIRALMSNPTISKRFSRAGKNDGKDSQSASQPKSRLAPQVARLLAQMWKKVFSRQGFFGVESAHFSTVYALQELLVASSQTYQSYRASNLLPRLEFNVIMVMLLVTNCWTTATIQIFLRKSPQLGRVFTFTYNAMIGFGMVTIVPLLIFVPYIQGFDLQHKIVKNQNFSVDPVTLVTIVLENRLLFAAGMLDFATKPIPHLSIMLSLVTVSELLGRGDVKVTPDARGPNMQAMTVNPKASSSNIGKPTDTQASSGKVPCASLVYDCHAQNTTTPDQTTFDKLDPVVFAALSIVHCSGLEMPPNFQILESLMTLQIYNSTIVSWDAKSAISATAHTRLLWVFVGRSQMAEVPQGVLQPLPATVQGIQFSHSNIKTLPNDLNLRWHSLIALSFDYGELADIPPQMFFSLARVLSFVGNQIETIPALAMLPAGAFILDVELAANPLKELPATLMEPTALIISMNVQYTSLTHMPEWVKTNTKVVWAYGTPFCATPMADPTLARRVMCFERPAEQDASYPMFLVDALFPYEK